MILAPGLVLYPGARYMTKKNEETLTPIFWIVTLNFVCMFVYLLTFMFICQLVCLLHSFVCLFVCFLAYFILVFCLIASLCVCLSTYVSVVIFFSSVCQNVPLSVLQIGSMVVSSDKKSVQVISGRQSTNHQGGDRFSVYYTNLSVLSCARLS